MIGNWRIVRIHATGLKGAAPLDMSIDGPTLIVGHNGAGKSRVLDAVAFALGRPVAGVASGGPDLLPAVAGDVCSVTLTLRADDRTVDLSRSRSIDAKSGAFGRPKVAIDGRPATDADVTAMFGDVSVPGGESWLIMSRDKVIATLGSIGAGTDDGRGAIATVRPKLVGVVPDAVLEAETATTDPAAWLAAARAAAKSAANDAVRAARAADDSAEISRQAAAQAGSVSPDRLRNAEANRDAIQVELDNAVRASAAASAAQCAAIDRRIGENAAAVAAYDRANSLARAIQQHESQDATTGSSASVKQARAAADIDADIQAVAAEIHDIGEAITAAHDDVDAKSGMVSACHARLQRSQQAEAVARSHVNLLSVVADTLRGGSCPTCRRASDPDVHAAFVRDHLTPANASVDMLADEVSRFAADVKLAENARGNAAQYLRELREQLANATTARDALFVELRTASEHAGAAANVEARAARLRELRESLAAAETQHRAMCEARDAIDTDGLRAEYAEAEAKVAHWREALKQAQAVLDNSQQAAARHTRHIEDLRRRDEARARKERCDAALDAVAAAEASVSDFGLGQIARMADPFIPPHFGRLDAVDGEIGLRTPAGAFICGAGLSGAQRVALTTAIDRAIEERRSLRVLMLEADAMDARSLTDIATSAVEAYHAETVGTVLIATCHEPAEPIDGMTVARIGGAHPTPPSPTPTPPPAPSDGDAKSQPTSHPAPDIHIAVSPEAVDAVMSQDGAWYVAQSTTVDVASQGETPAEALANLGEALALHGEPEAPEQTTVIRDGNSDLHTHPAAGAQPDLFAVAKLPDFLAKPGRTMLARKPDREHVARVVAALSSEAARYMHGWPGMGAEPGPRPDTSSLDIVNELIDADILSDDPMDCRLTYGGVEAWRLIHGVDPVRSDAQALREDQPPPQGAGLTEGEIDSVISAAKLSADALRFLGLTRTGLNTATKRTAPIWRRHIARALYHRGTDAEALGRWIAEAAEKHPKKTEQPTDATDIDDGE